MEKPNQSSESTDRRKHTRLSVFSFMHATATVSSSTEQKSRDERRQHWTGLLEDISYDGAQIILPNDCGGHLKEQQNVAIEIKTTFVEDMRINVAAQVIHIAPAENHKGVRVGVKFTGLDINSQARDAILKICEYGRKLKIVSKTQAEQPAYSES